MASSGLLKYIQRHARKWRQIMNPMDSPMESDPEKGGKRHDLWRPVLLLSAVIAVLALARILGWAERIDDLREWIRSLGVWGPLVYALIYIAATVAALPGSVMTLLAGALFGSLVGTVVVSLASIIGASLAFLIARYFARDAVARWLSKNEKFRRLDEMTEKYGAVIVAIVRLIPLFPFDLLNYGFGLTRISFRTYVFWSWLCMIPGTILYVVGADALTKGIAEGKAPWPLIAVLAAAAVIVAFLVRYARQMLRDKEKAGEQKS
jgi:uncharacterized membrane protein YdjX (TVP38/TMEM64 family)